MMLSFEIDKSGKAIQIYCDNDGLASLISELQKLGGEGSHIHLRAPSVGGQTLNDQNPWGTEAIGEVVVTLS